MERVSYSFEIERYAKKAEETLAKIESFFMSYCVYLFLNTAKPFTGFFVLKKYETIHLLKSIFATAQFTPIADSFENTYARFTLGNPTGVLEFGVRPILSDLPETCGVWYHGVSGCGKSETARKNYPGAYLKSCDDNWNRYGMEQNVIVENVDTLNKNIMHQQLMVWADRFAFEVDVGRTPTRIRPNALVVTSVYHPSDIWGDSVVKMDTIIRRFKVINLNPTPVEQDFDFMISSGYVFSQSSQS